jgi:sirohydrochlorin ferrochelatase
MANTAVLVIAHGSPDPDWLELVETAVRQCGSRLPIRTAYLGGVEGRSIGEEWKRLENAGADRIIVVPLFVTEGSSHLGEIRSMLGLDEGNVTESSRISVSARILWCPPLEDDPLVERIVAQRISALSRDPRQESLLLVGHGSDQPGGHEVWEQLMHRLTIRLNNRFCFAAAGHASLRPDTVRVQACRLAESGNLLVVPLFVSQGYFTRKAIPQRLEGLSYRYEGSTYLPHPLIATWIRQSIHKAWAKHIFSQRSVYGNGRAKIVEMG